MADPLGLVPYKLQGLGPKKTLMSGATAGQHTIFLFDENSITKVMDAYGELLLDTFSDLEIREEWFTAAAVGQVHNPPDDGKDHKFPHYIGRYWKDYDPELTKHDPPTLSFSTSSLDREDQSCSAKLMQWSKRLLKVFFDWRILELKGSLWFVANITIVIFSNYWRTLPTCWSSTWAWLYNSL